MCHFYDTFIAIVKTNNSIAWTFAKKDPHEKRFDSDRFFYFFFDKEKDKALRAKENYIKKVKEGTYYV